MAVRQKVVLAYSVYEGFWFSPLPEALDAFKYRRLHLVESEPK